MVPFRSHPSHPQHPCTRCLALLFLWLTAAATMLAHDPGLSTAEGHVHGDQLTLTFAFAASDAHCLWAGTYGRESEMPTPADRRWTAIARSWCSVHALSGVSAPQEIKVTPNPGGGIQFTLTYRLAPGVVSLSLARWGEMPRGHREFAMISRGGRLLLQKFLTREDARADFTVSAANGEETAPRTPPSFVGFLKLGIEHIWTGYDHLLFLFGLLVICRSFRSIAAIISCFTVAHSLTLAAATLNLVHLPSQWVECAIAASIAFVGVENIMRRGAEPPGRAGLTFTFGLIHGFGFASALSDLGVGSNGHSVVIPLFSFNLGVELGQIAVAAVALPVIYLLRTKERFVRQGVPVLSSIVAAAGVFWFVQRIVA